MMEHISGAESFQRAGIDVTRKLFEKAKADGKMALLEPIMKVSFEQIISDDYGPILGYIGQKRGIVQEIKNNGNEQNTVYAIDALMPLFDIMDISKNVNSLTQGRCATFSIFDGYCQVPEEKKELIIKALS
jgi:translation elongation factor EF-G